MASSIALYILMSLVIVINLNTTESPGPTSFMGYPVEYQDIDTYSCVTTTTTFIPDDTSTMCLTSTEAITTVDIETTAVIYTSVSTTTSTTTTSTSTTSTTTTSTSTTSTTTTSTSTTSTTTTSTTTTSTTTASTTTTSTSTTSTTTTSTTTTSTTTTTYNTSSIAFVPPACPNQTLGPSCNISSDPCSMLQPCLNLATCYLNTSLPLGYLCVCVTGFSGSNCEIDNRPCRPGYSCLNGGTCNETSNDTNCVCSAGNTGDHCEYTIDVCKDIACQNGGQCISVSGNWSCLCTNTALYSGAYCQTKSTSLVIKEIFSRSFGVVAIGCIVAVMGFVIIMDILKYFFNVNPLDRSIRLRREMQTRKHQEERRRYGKKKFKQPVVAVRFQYVDG